MRARPVALFTAVVMTTGLMSRGGPPAQARPSSSVTHVTIDGSRPGPRYWGLGAISAGGSSRLLIDYPEPQRSEILDYLFKPGFGAALQLLKLEIGGDSNSSAGAEPSIEPTKGAVDCGDGYEWWLAEQAVRRNPGIKLYGLQWGAPGWVGAARALWTRADVGYVLTWLGCARAHGLTISYLGTWNEHFRPLRDPAGVTWTERLRAALDRHGYRKVQIVAADATHHPWDVARAMAEDPAFRAAVGVVGVHDACGLPDSDTVPFGYTCAGPPAGAHPARPLWASEDGRTDANLNAATMIRELLNGYNQAGLTGALEWPLVTATVDGIPMENRGLVTAKWPWSGQYAVNRIAWVIAQLTQFVPQGWRHVDGANRALGPSGSYNAFESPRRRQWSLVAQNTGATAGQHVAQQTIRVRVRGGLRAGPVHVWATNVWSADPAKWLVQWQDVQPWHGRFSYHVLPGYVISFTTRSAAVRRGSSSTSHAPGTFTPAAMPPAYAAAPDAAGMAGELSPMDGSFLYRPCAGGRTGTCLEQTDDRPPVFWWPPASPRRPYAEVGDSTWRDYSVGSDVLFTSSGSTAGIIGRVAHGFANFSTAGQFDGYEFTCGDDGSWALYRNSATTGRTLLQSGTVGALGIDTWHRLTMSFAGSLITPAVDGQPVGTFTDATWAVGPAGIESGWAKVQFDQLTVG